MTADMDGSFDRTISRWFAGRRIDASGAPCKGSALRWTAKAGKCLYRLLRHDIPGHRTHPEDAASYDRLPRRRAARFAAPELLPRLAGALAFLAPSAAGVLRTGLPLRRARHARLRAIEHLCAPRGRRARADRPGHARAAGVAR